MKKSTTIIDKVKSRASFFIVMLFVLGGVISLFAPTLSSSDQVFANTDRLQDQLDAIEEEMEKKEKSADHKHAQAESLKEAITQLENEAETLELQIKKSTLEKERLEKKIEETRKKITNNQEVLASTVGDLYIDGDLTPIEMLASSHSIGDYVDKQEYRSAVKDQVTTAIKTIEKLKESLESEKKAVEDVIEQKKSQERQLMAKREEKDNLLAKTEGEEAKYRERIEELEAEQSAVMEEIQAAMAASASSGGVGSLQGLAGEGFVQAGTPIGRSGDTGFSFGCHLHLEVLVNGQAVDPSPYLNQPGWVTPASAGITQGFGNPNSWYGSGYHTGIDYGATCGQTIVAAADGKLSRGWILGSTCESGYGYAAVIDHGNGVETLYGHFYHPSCY